MTEVHGEKKRKIING